MEKQIVHFCDSRPGRRQFRQSHLWCAYKYPSELAELREWGVSEAEVNENVLAKVQRFHCHPYYSIPESVLRVDRDLLYLAAHVELPGSPIKYDGCFVGQ